MSIQDQKFSLSTDSFATVDKIINASLYDDLIEEQQIEITLNNGKLRTYTIKLKNEGLSFSVKNNSLLHRFIDFFLHREVKKGIKHLLKNQQRISQLNDRLDAGVMKRKFLTSCESLKTTEDHQIRRESTLSQRESTLSQRELLLSKKEKENAEQAKLNKKRVIQLKTETKKLNELRNKVAKETENSAKIFEVLALKRQKMESDPEYYALISDNQANIDRFNQSMVY